MSGSGHATAGSADLAAESYSDSDNKQTSVGYEEPVAKTEIESYEEPVAKTEIESYEEPVTNNHYEEPVAKTEFESYEKPVTNNHSERKTKLDAKIPSEIQADESDDGQQRLPGQSVYGPISDEEWINFTELEPRDHLRSASIFRVPEFLKDTKKEAYVPETVSLGPYHNNSKEVLRTRDFKVEALRIMMMRANKKHHMDPSVKDLINQAADAILRAEDKIRAIYKENIDCDGKTLSRMLCLDGCFILEVLRTLEGDTLELDHTIFGGSKSDASKSAASKILKDIVMLENQIPWIVLVELLRMEYPSDVEVKTKLLTLLVSGTWPLFQTVVDDKTALIQRLNQIKEVDHVLDFLYKAILDQPPIDSRPADKDAHRITIGSCIGNCSLILEFKNTAVSSGFESIPRAVKLNNAGIKFRPCGGGISGIWFDKRGLIHLPAVCITYGTEVLFRNLIAFEMCRPSEPSYVSSYVNLMADLIGSQKDVALLRSNGILTNQIASNKEVADLFNGLSKDVGTVRMGYLFREVKSNVNELYRNKFRVQFAEFVQDHFSSSWKALATVAVTVILFLVGIDATFTTLSVYKN